MSRKLVVYIATSIDGYIAKPNDNLDFLSIVQKEGEDYGYFDFINTIDTVIIGRKTYDWVMQQVPKFPHADKQTYVITRITKPADRNIQFYNRNIRSLVEELKSLPGKNIFCDGGAEIVNTLLKEKLVDEMIISIIPILVGSGIRLFTENRPEQKMELISAKSFDSGLVQVHYTINNS